MTTPREGYRPGDEVVARFGRICIMNIIESVRPGQVHAFPIARQRFNDMPRRPRLSVPSLFLGSPDAYAVWDAEGRIVDRNEAFQKLFAPNESDSASNAGSSAFLAYVQGESSILPESAFRGELRSRLVNHPGDASRVIRVEAWPIHGEPDSIIGVLGRITPVAERDITETADPSRVWGKALQDELTLRRARQKTMGFESLPGFGPVHEAILKLVEAAVRADCPVVIVGEAATGRHHMARIVHLKHQARQGARLPLIPIDPASLPSELLARDFLGIDFGTETGAASQSQPAWRVPPGATILIESLADLDTRLQDGIARAAGSVRLISLAHSHDEIDRLQPWLRARVATIVIELTPLRRRIEEIPILAQSILDRLQAGTRPRIEGFSPEALERLKLYDWPGNWRELERIVRKIHASATGPLVLADDIPAEILGAFGGAWTKPVNTERPASGHRLESAIQNASRATVLQALERFGSNKAAVARSLGISRPKLYRLLAELGLDSE